MKNTISINFKKSKNSKGQAVLFAVVGVTIALALGVTVASRNLNSLSRTSRTDSTARAYSAAEGGIERLLALTDSQLETLYNNGGTPNCTGAGFVASQDAAYQCRLVFPTTTGDKINSVAELKVEPYIYNQTNYLKLDLVPGYTTEVALRKGATQFNGTITICWKGTDASYQKDPVIYYFTYNENGVLARGALREPTTSYAANLSSNGFTSPNSSKAPDFTYCRSSVSLGANPYGLRIKTLYQKATIGIYPSLDLPVQGYKFTVVGKVLQQQDVMETKKVTLYRSLPYMPAFFDSAIYSGEGSINN